MKTSRKEWLEGGKLIARGFGVVFLYFGLVAVLMYPAVDAARTVI